VHRRVSRQQVLADLREGRLTPNGAASLRGFVNETYDWGDGTSCQDSVPTPRLQLILGAGPGTRARVPVALLSNNGSQVPVLRTHCPGPTDTDLVGPNGNLASGSIPPAELLAKHLTLTLTEPSGFSGLGYTGTRNGSIQLDLTLTKVTAATRP
jgi:hypothetical protein